MNMNDFDDDDDTGDNKNFYSPEIHSIANNMREHREKLN